jgi:hypothetical protein
MAASRPIRRPRQGLSSVDLPVMRNPPRELFRLHRKGHDAIYFSINPDHRFSHAACPYGLLYLGEDFFTCLWERFGDDILSPGSMVSFRLWATRSISRLMLPSLKICDLTDEQTRTRAGVDLSALTSSDLSVPQDWGLAIQQHPAGFHGLRYFSRFSGKPCIALFDRPGLTMGLRTSRVGDLLDYPDAELFLTQHQIALV